MIIGEPLLVYDTSVEYVSPWFPRGGNAFSFSCNLILKDNLETSNIIVETKTQNRRTPKPRLSQPAGRKSQ